MRARQTLHWWGRSCNEVKSTRTLKGPRGETVLCNYTESSEAEQKWVPSKSKRVWCFTGTFGSHSFYFQLILQLAPCAWPSFRYSHVAAKGTFGRFWTAINNLSGFFCHNCLTKAHWVLLVSDSTWTQHHAATVLTTDALKRLSDAHCWVLSRLFPGGDANQPNFTWGQDYQWSSHNIWSLKTGYDAGCAFMATAKNEKKSATQSKRRLSEQAFQWLLLKKYRRKRKTGLLSMSLTPHTSFYLCANRPLRMTARCTTLKLLWTSNRSWQFSNVQVCARKVTK